MVAQTVDPNIQKAEAGASQLSSRPERSLSYRPLPPTKKIKIHGKQHPMVQVEG